MTRVVMTGWPDPTSGDEHNVGLFGSGNLVSERRVEQRSVTEKGSEPGCDQNGDNGDRKCRQDRVAKRFPRHGFSLGSSMQQPPGSGPGKDNQQEDHHPAENIEGEALQPQDGSHCGSEQAGIEPRNGKSGTE